MVDPLTLLMCSPISDGAAAVVLIALTQNGGGWLEGDSAAMAVHILSAD